MQLLTYNWWYFIQKMQLLFKNNWTEIKDSYKTLKDINNKIDYQKNETNQKIKK